MSDFSVTMIPSEGKSFWLETSSVNFGSLLALAASEGVVGSAEGLAEVGVAGIRGGGGLSASGDGTDAPGVAGDPGACTLGAPSAVSRARRRLRI